MSGHALDLLVVGVLAFIAGMLFTMVCVHFEQRNWKRALHEERRRWVQEYREKHYAER